MGIASMIIGIIALVSGLVPFCGTWAIAPAFVGLILGIVDLAIKTSRGKPRGMAVAGVILNPIAILVVVAWWYFAASMGAEAASLAPPPGIAAPPPIAPFPSQQPLPDPQQAPFMQPMQPMQPVPPAPPPPAPAAPAQNP